MVYQDNDWKCADLPFRYRVAELYLRTLIGGLYGVLVVCSILWLTGGEEPYMFLLALSGWVLFGLKLSLPDKKPNAK